MQEPPVVITPYADGPLIVRGAVEIRSPDGTRIDPGRDVVALCRCGRSALKPFCDGSHVGRFRAGSGAEGSRRRGQGGMDGCEERQGSFLESAPQLRGGVGRDA